MRNFLFSNATKTLLLLATVVSVCSFIYFYSNQLNLFYGDAVSRLNIARKITDNLTPGLGQLGNVWLPLPHLLMAPFTYSEFLWHTGIAGWILSGTSFVLLILFLYKIGVDIFGSKLSGLVMISLVITNINVIYMQTTAMTEVFFITTVVAAIYYLMKWSKNNELLELINGALWVSAASLIRYEGYFVVVFAVLLVVVVSYIKYRNKKTTEGTTIKFATLAFTGIALWMVYLAVVFGNPFIWMEIYSGKAAVISTEQATFDDIPKGTPPNPDLIFHTIQYFISTMHMNGFIVTVWGSLLFLIFVLFISTNSRWKNSSYLLFLLIPLSVYAFIIMSFNRGLPLKQPGFSLNNIFNPASNYVDSEYNIRYGINALPFIALMIGWAASKKKFLAYLSSVIISIQLASTIAPSYFLIYQLPTKFVYELQTQDKSLYKSVTWFKEHYTGGTIMISAYKHDPQMFFFHLPYKTYLHEGTQKYWLEARENPQKYASWIYMYKPPKDPAEIKKSDEPVTKWVGGSEKLDQYYDLLYEDGMFVIYKIKTKPEILLDI